MDRALVERARRGDHEAFSALAAASIDRLYAVATLILRDPDRAEDAVQDSLVSAWRGIRGLRDANAWESWMHRNLVRSCYRQARSDQRRISLWLRLPATEPSIGDSAAAVADRDELERGFRYLSIEHRSVIVLRFYLDLSLPDVASVLGVPEGTAKSRLHRATAALRAALTAEVPAGTAAKGRTA